MIRKPSLTPNLPLFYMMKFLHFATIKLTSTSSYISHILFNIPQPAEGGGMKLSFLLTVTDSNRRQTIHVAFCFPFSYAECQKMLNKLEMKHSSEVATCNSEVPDESCEQSPLHMSMDSEIYFHR